MIIYGAKHIKNQFSSLRFSFNGDLTAVNCLAFSEENLLKSNIKKAIFCTTLSEVLQANAALVDFIIPSKNILKDSVLLAEKYLFDSKILSFISDLDELNHLAFSGIDCVLLLNFDESFKDFFPAI